jgi:hypothetical protein
LHSYGLADGYDRLVVADVIVLSIEAPKGIGAADNKVLQAKINAGHHSPSSPGS